MNTRLPFYGIIISVVLLIFIVILIVLRCKFQFFVTKLTSNEQRKCLENKVIVLLISITFLVIIFLIIALVTNIYLVQFFAASSNNNNNNNNSNTNGLSATATVSTTMTRLTELIEDVITSTNTTVLAACYEEWPNLLALFNKLAQEYLDVLSVDLDFTPLINTIDKFLLTVKSSLFAMNQIKNARDNEIANLLKFANNLQQLQGQLQTTVNSACSKSPSNGLSVSQCNGVNVTLKFLTVGLDYSKINSDSSITIVTLLDRIIRLNITEVEQQVSGAKGLLTGALTSVQSEVNGLIDSLISTVSGAFDSALAGAQNFSYSAQSFSESDTFQNILSISSGISISVSVMHSIISVILLIVLFCFCFVLFVYIKLKFFSKLSDPSTDSRSNAVSFIYTTPCHIIWYILTVLFILLFIIGYCLLVVGVVVENDACRYLQKPEATKVLDDQLNSVINNTGWPVVMNLLKYYNIPITLQADQAPENIFKALLTECRNKSVTIFEIFELTDIVNGTEVLESDLVMSQLRTGEDMVRKLILDLDASTIIPASFDAIIARLPEIAAMIDTEDFTSSIVELNKPLLRNPDQVSNLIIDLKSMSDSLQQDQNSDKVLLKHFASELQKLSQDQSVLVTSQLQNLKSHFQTLRENQIVGQLTINLTRDVRQMKLTLSNTPFALQSVKFRFNQILAKYIPIFAVDINLLAAKILNSIGYCYGFNSILQDALKICSKDVTNIFLSGLFYVIGYSIALILFIPVLLMMLQLTQDRKSKGVSDNGGEGKTALSDTQRSSRYYDDDNNNNNNNHNNFSKNNHNETQV